MKEKRTGIKLSVLFLGLSLALATPAYGPPKTLAPQDINAANTAIVVFTGDERRIIEGLHLYMAGYGDKLFITGIDIQGTDLMQMYENAGFLPQRATDGIHTDPLAQTTYENAINTKRWLAGRNIGRVVLVTSDFHIPRSHLLLQRQLGLTNIQIETFSVPSRTTASGLQQEARKYRFTKWGIPTNAKRLVQLMF